jgi:microcystin-dependent protein
MDATQAMQIADLQAEDVALQAQIDAVQMTAADLLASVNGSTALMDLNMTLDGLLTQVNLLQLAVTTLQTQVAMLSAANVPVGAMTPWTGAAGGPYPADWLPCDGATYASATYPDLFAVVGTMYCFGCAPGDFAVPDMRGRVPAGKGGSVLNVPIGSQAGTETHTLSTAEMPTHAHSGTTDFGGSHIHMVGVGLHPTVTTMMSPCPMRLNNQPAIAVDQCGIPGTFTLFDSWDIPAAGSDHYHTMTVSNAGSSSAHPNIQPTLVVQYIIKAQ